VFGTVVLRRICGPKRGEATRERRILHDDGINGLHSSPTIVRVIKSRRMKLAGHVARMGVYRVLMGKSEGKRPLGSPRLDRTVILRWISGSGFWGYGLD
jgi:hypothetical protein